MKFCVLLFLVLCAAIGCVRDVGLGPNCELDCAACGLCDAAVLPFCGNGIVDTGEDCDGEAQSGADTCDSECNNTECGNGALEEGEACDSPFDGIAACVNCSQVSAVVCGNGATEAGEECDDQNRDALDGCGPDCQLETRTPAVCGNQSIESGEECDDGNLLAADGCSPECQIETGWVCEFTPTLSRCRER